MEDFTSSLILPPLLSVSFPLPPRKVCPLYAFAHSFQSPPPTGEWPFHILSRCSGYKLFFFSLSFCPSFLFKSRPLSRRSKLKRFSLPFLPLFSIAPMFPPPLQNIQVGKPFPPCIHFLLSGRSAPLNLSHPGTVGLSHNST